MQTCLCPRNLTFLHRLLVWRQSTSPGANDAICLRAAPPLARGWRWMSAAPLVFWVMTPGHQLHSHARTKISRPMLLSLELSHCCSAPRDANILCYRDEWHDKTIAHFNEITIFLADIFLFFGRHNLWGGRAANRLINWQIQCRPV